MIFLSLVLVIVAAVALVLGLFQDGLVLIYVSMVTTLAAMLVLAVASLLRRRQEATTAAPASYGAGTVAASTAVARTPVAPLGRTGTDTEEPGAEGAGGTADDRAFQRPADRTDAAGTGSTAMDRPARKRAVVKRTRVAPSDGSAPPTGSAAGGPTARDLTTVRGLGPAKRERLLEHFGSVEAIAAATVDQLTEVPGIGVGTARAIKDALS